MHARRKIKNVSGCMHSSSNILHSSETKRCLFFVALPTTDKKAKLRPIVLGGLERECVGSSRLLCIVIVIIKEEPSSPRRELNS